MITAVLTVAAGTVFGVAGIALALFVTLAQFTSPREAIYRMARLVPLLREVCTTPTSSLRTQPIRLHDRTPTRPMRAVGGS